MNVARAIMGIVLGLASASVFAAQPNVILIMTDDQGYGDFGVTGNPVIATPHLDAMAARSVWMRTFYVSPVCSPTRASLLTGRYNYRTRCIDTFIGRSMMEPSEVTLAEVLRDAGYATGIFGKWHLGDSYPMRAMDQGFEESLVHRGGGLAQPADPPENFARYVNPVLMHNGEPVRTEGFCTDVYFGAAMDWIAQKRTANRPFFAYIATNAPHTPLHDVPISMRARYEQADFSAILPSGHTPTQREQLVRIAAMITNIDDNVGRLFARLDALGITDDTLVIFLNDNGPQQRRFNGPFRGLKSEVYEGGVRSPFWMHWPGTLEEGYRRDEPVAHIDVLPTILEACGVDAPAGVQLDGRSFWGIVTGKSNDWPERPIVLQTHRGDVPVRNHQFMIRQGPWKLLHASGFGRESFSSAPGLELYDLASDPGETTNVIGSHPAIAAQLHAEYLAWFDDVSSTRPDNYAPPRICIGTPHENPTVLTQQDWRGAPWNTWGAAGAWMVTIEPGSYNLNVRLKPISEPGVVEVRIGDTFVSAVIGPNANRCVFEHVELHGGDVEVRGVVRYGDRERGVHQIEIEKR